MTFAKAVCLVATVLGILIIIFPAFYPMSGTVSSIVSAASAILVAIGSYFFAYLGQNEKMERMEKKYQHNMNVLQEQISESGLDFFIKQYAEDLMEVRLIQDTLNDIQKYAQTDPINGEAIKQALLGIRRLHFKGFLSKAGELLYAGGHVELLNRFLGHLEAILQSHREIPDSLREEIQQLREIQETKRKRLT